MTNDPEFLRLCTNPLCDRAVAANSLGERRAEYCCTACWEAHRGRYEIHEDGPLAHSNGCDMRWQERQGREVRYAR